MCLWELWEGILFSRPSVQRTNDRKYVRDVLFPLYLEEPLMEFHQTLRKHMYKANTTYKQVAQRATIAHLRANFTFSYCKSMGDDDFLGHG